MNFVKKEKIIFSIILILIALPLLSTPITLTNLNVYNDITFIDSSIQQVTVGTQFYLKAETNAPTTPTIPPDFFYVTIIHTSDLTDTITIKLTQDAYDSKAYKSSVITIVPEGSSNSSLNYIGVKANSGELIKFFYNGIEYDSLIVTISTGPIMLNNLNFMASDYSSILSGAVPAFSTLYIEANGTDGNELTIDTLLIHCTSTLDLSGIKIELLETGNNTGKYRGFIYLDVFSDTNLKRIKAYNNDDIIYISSEVNQIIRSDSISIKLSQPPSTILLINFKEENYTTNINREILPDEKLYIEAIGEDSNNLTIDTIGVIIANINQQDSIIITLTETNSNSGKFRGIAELSTVTNNTLNRLKANFGDTIIVYPILNNNISNTIFITVPHSPQIIQSLNFMNSSYSLPAGEYTNSYTKLYIELTAIDLNQFYPDTVEINVSSTYDNIVITLTETGKNTGIFRGFLNLNNYTYQKLNTIKAYQNGDTIIINKNNYFDTITIQTTASPTNIIAINVKIDENSDINKITEYAIDEFVYVEVIVEDLNPLTIDILEMQAYSSSNSNDIINFNLTEISNDSGIFRGKFKITTLSNDTVDELKANYGDTIYIGKLSSADINDTIQIKVTIPKPPRSINLLQFTTTNYQNEWPDYLQVNMGDNIYIRATATDENELINDTVGVILYTLDTSDTPEYIYNLILTETGKHTGIYTGYVKLDQVNKLPALNQMKTTLGATIILSFGDTPYFILSPNELNYLIQNCYDTIQTVKPIPPTKFLAIRLKDSSNFSDNKYSPIMWTYEDDAHNIITKYLYVEIEADKTTSSNLIADTVKIMVQSTTEKNGGDTNIFELIETGLHTGIFRNGANDIPIVNYDNVGQVFFSNRLEIRQGDYVEITVLDPTTLQPSATIQPFRWHTANYLSPTVIKRISVYRDASYSVPITNSLLSFEPPFNTIYFEVEAYDFVGSSTMPYANDELQDTVEIILSSQLGYNNPDTISIILRETAVSSNLYRNYIITPRVINYESSFSYELETRRSDTIYIYANVSGESAPIILFIANYRQPTEIRKIQFYTDNTYSKILDYDLLFGDNIYIEVEGYGSSELLQDTIEVVLYRNLSGTNFDDSITVLLLETSVGSEKYRIAPNEIVPQLYYFTRDSVNYLYATAGDIISVAPIGSYTALNYFVFGYPQSPTELYSLRASLSSSFSEYLSDSSFIPQNTNLYIEVIGDVGSNAIIDTLSCRVINLTKNPNEIVYFTLTETGKRTGYYHGSISLSNISNPTLKLIGVNIGDCLKIEVPDSQSLNVSFYIIATSTPIPITLTNILFMDQTYTNIITSNVSRTAKLYVEINGLDASQYSQDTISVICKSETDTNGIIITLLETGLNTGKFRGFFTLSSYSDDLLDYLKVNDFDTVTILANNRDNSETLTATIKVMPSISPNEILSIKFKNLDFSGIISSELPLNSTLNIEATAIDLNSATADTIMVNIVNKTKQETITLILYETTNSSGIFRNSATSGNLTNQSSKILKAEYGDIINVFSNINPNIVDTAYITYPRAPIQLNNIQFMNSNYTEKSGLYVPPEATLYIEANGIDANSLTIDTVLCLVSSSKDTSGILVTLIETDKNTGKYYNTVTLKNFSDTTTRYIKATSTDDIIYVQTISPYQIFTDTVIIKSSTTPDEIINIMFKEANYISELQREVLPDETIYIEALAIDKNPNTIDTILVNISNSQLGETIFVTLFEINNNSFLFRGNFKLSETATNQTQLNLKARYGDTIIAQIYNQPAKYSILFVTYSRPPILLNNFQFTKSNYNELLGEEISVNTNLYIEANGLDGNPLLKDEISCTVISSSVNEPMIIKLIETGENTGKYRGSFTIRTFSDFSNNIIKAISNDTIIISVMINSIIYYDSVNVVSYIGEKDENILSLYFKTNNYQQRLQTEILPDAELFIELSKIDENQNNIDSIIVYLINNRIPSTNPSCSIPITLYETLQNSGIFRNNAFLGELTNITLKTLSARYGDSITVYCRGWADTIFITTPKPPTLITNINFMKSDFSSILPDNEIITNSILNVEVNGSDGNSLTIDTIICYAFSTYVLENEAISIILTETNKNTGKYRGSFRFADFTNDNLDYIKAVETNDTIVIFVYYNGFNKLYDSIVIRSTTLSVNELSYTDTETKTINQRTIKFSGIIGDTINKNGLYIYNSELNDTIFIDTFITNINFTYSITFNTDGYKKVVFIGTTENNLLPHTIRMLEFNIDKTPPILNIIKPLTGEYINQNIIEIEGRVNHQTKSDTVKINCLSNEYYVKLDEIDTYNFSCSFPISGLNNNDTIKLLITAIDFVGNTTAKEIILIYKTEVVSNISVDKPQIINISKDSEIINIRLNTLENKVPDTTQIIIENNNGNNIILSIQFADTANPLLLVINDIKIIEEKIKETIDAIESVKKYGSEEYYNAGLQTVREYKIYRNGVLIEDTNIFSEIYLTFEVPQIFRVNKNYTIYTFNETAKLWEPLPASRIIRNDAENKITAKLEHFSIYGIFLAAEQVSNNLTNVIVFPNPFIPYDGNPQTGSEFRGNYTDPTNMTGIHIKNLTGNNEINIYNLNGELIRKYETDMNTARIIWDGKNQDGENVSSGLYLIVIKNNNGEKVIKKVTIIR
ncbi:MAG TPA: FlgD immunoglobulin-like domain containing protein [bacterium]|nr:FlgD immunoglobulin-like domain containing protein [bacterium]HOL47390.1 FlgD immunoglobulin-like domain containing protein [bacterium]HPQ18111.1 FlgD immunoglobulin-like domain containing protein [bacterium]